MSDDPPIGHGIEDEPHLRPPRRPDEETASSDVDEERAAELLRDEGRRGGRDGDAARDSVFEEAHAVRVASPPPDRVRDDRPCPRCGTELRGSLLGEACPGCGQVPAATWSGWFQARRAETPAGTSWTLTLLIGLLSVPLATFVMIFPVELAVLPIAAVVTPVFEEVVKVLALTMLVETRPYLLRSVAQIRVAAVLSALGFALVEFLLRAIPSFSTTTEPLELWTRFGALLAMHLVSTLLVAEGVVRVWLACEHEGRRPDLGPVARWLLAGFAVHACFRVADWWLVHGGSAA